MGPRGRGVDAERGERTGQSACKLDGSPGTGWGTLIVNVFCRRREGGGFWGADDHMSLRKKKEEKKS